MDIYSTDFTPTYLYIKQHSITEKFYFGKTIQDPETYYGSGIRWTRHIDKHGKKHVKTLWYCLFYDEDAINEFALLCSQRWNIVESEEWLNLITETGEGDNLRTETSIERMRNAKLGKPSVRKGSTHTEESNEKNRIAHTGKTFEKIPCQNCGRLTAIQHMKRHMNKCDTTQINN